MVVNKNGYEPLESMIRRLKRKVNNSGIMQEVKRNRYYEKPSEKKKRKIRDNQRRIQKENKKMRMGRRG